MVNNQSILQQKRAREATPPCVTRKIRRRLEDRKDFVESGIFHPIREPVADPECLRSTAHRRRLHGNFLIEFRAIEHHSGPRCQICSSTPQQDDSFHLILNKRRRRRKQKDRREITQISIHKHPARTSPPCLPAASSTRTPPQPSPSCTARKTTL
jgi:hypothetical protein